MDDKERTIAFKLAKRRGAKSPTSGSTLIDILMQSRSRTDDFKDDRPTGTKTVTTGLENLECENPHSSMLVITRV